MALLWSIPFPGDLHLGPVPVNWATLTLLLAPGIAIFVLSVAPRILWQQWRLVLVAAGVLALCSGLVYLYLPVRAAMDPPIEYADPQTWEGFWYVVLGEQFQGTFGPLPSLAGMGSLVWDELGGQVDVRRLQRADH